MNDITLYVDGNPITFSKVVDHEFNNIQYEEKRIDIINEPFSISCELKMSQKEMKSFKKTIKRLSKLPRKLKKKTYGTRKAKNKLIRKMKACHPFTIKDIERAGLTLEVKNINYNYGQNVEVTQIPYIMEVIK